MMKKRFYIIIALISILTMTVRAQNMTFKGKVGKYGIVVYIEQYNDGTLKGWCYYTSQGANNKIPINGSYSGNSLTIYEYDNDVPVGLFTLVYNRTARTMTGTHYNVNTRNELSVNLQQTNNTTSINDKPGIIGLLRNNIAKYPTESKMYKNSALKKRMTTILGTKKYNMIVSQLACCQLEYTNGYYFCHGWLMHSFNEPGYYFMYNAENDNLSIVWMETMNKYRVYQEKPENVISTLKIIEGWD